MDKNEVNDHLKKWSEAIRFNETMTGDESLATVINAHDTEAACFVAALRRAIENSHYSEKLKNEVLSALDHGRMYPVEVVDDNNIWYENEAIAIEVAFDYSDFEKEKQDLKNRVEEIKKLFEDSDNQQIVQVDESTRVFPTDEIHPGIITSDKGPYTIPTVNDTEKKVYRCTINGTEVSAFQNSLDYAMIVAIAGFPADRKDVTVTYFKKLDGDVKRSGMLLHNEVIEDIDGMEIDAAYTGNA